jgi:hypothetical protein
MKIITSAKKLKVTAVLDAAPFASLGEILDSAPPRTNITVHINGHAYSADLATKSVRKAVKTLNEHGVEQVTLLIQGNLTAGNRIEEAGLSSTVKVTQEIT